MEITKFSVASFSDVYFTTLSIFSLKCYNLVKCGFQHENVSDIALVFSITHVCEFTHNGIKYFKIRFYFKGSACYTSDD
jgi:hypothetical protein